MPRRTFLVTAAAMATLGLSACGGEESPAIELSGTDALEFEPASFTVPADEPVTVELTSGGGVGHNFTIEDVDGEDVEVVAAEPGQTETGTFTIDTAGTYNFFCSVPGHRGAGMEGPLEIAGDG